MTHDRFKGDFTRNEVELDLNKFMELLQETVDLKDKIRSLEMDEKRNPWIKWIHLAHTIDAWRIFPRLFFFMYTTLIGYASLWFMSLPDPSIAQSGLISILVGAGAAWFGLYVSTGSGVRSNKPIIIKEIREVKSK